MRDAPRALLIGLDILLISSPAVFGSTAIGYAAATAIMLATTALLVGTWESLDRIELTDRDAAATVRSQAGQRPWMRRGRAVLVAIAAGLILFFAASDYVHSILISPIDAQRADMLVVIQQGIRRVLQGRNPYTIYHVPWDVTLPYGPMMWAPYVLPFALHIDVRFVSLLGELFIPVVCALVAVGSAFDGALGSCAMWLVLLAAVTFSPDLHAFTPIAHTPSYWPLVALLAWVVARRRWYASAVLCGLLIVARTTMVSIVPVLLMAVWHESRGRAADARLKPSRSMDVTPSAKRESSATVDMTPSAKRESSANVDMTPSAKREWSAKALAERPLLAVTGLLVTATVLPYLPFLIWDWRSLWYALYGSYQSLMKGFVWTSTTWARDSVGVTGLLLRMHREAWVEAVQIAAMLGVYVLAWRALARGRRPLPWMGLALLMFSMTTLWPVGYIYLDVFLLFAAGALAETDWLGKRRLASLFVASIGLAALVVSLVAWQQIPRDPSIDVGSAADRPYLYKGFADDERGDRTFAWVDGSRAAIAIPRRSRRDAELDIVCQPNLENPHRRQDMHVALNGVVLGAVSLREGWQTVTLPAPARAWQIGVNELVLSFASAVSPLEMGVGADSRKLSVAFDRLIVRAK